MARAIDTVPARSRAPRRDAAENRAAILAAAASALNADIDASIEAIAAEAGLSRRAVYGHFATREDLVAEVLAAGAARVGASLEHVSHPDARVEIALFGATLWSEVEHTRVTAQLAVRDPYRERVASALAPARDLLRRTVARGAADGCLRSDVAPETLARLIESSAIAVLDEATRTGMPREQARRLVMANGLSTAGLGWREARGLIENTPQLQAVSDDVPREEQQTRKSSDTIAVKRHAQ